ncbi:interleukin-13 receptor subunit alpha-1-like [Sander lucioperca]|uniref:Interleukin-13 receptor subunit alpha-1-like n=1 Tax=Sander lucioperca TaxID=283035 RepID=A0A8C9ZZK8_SANLU|nr:interleukin-13 receptor subunit alpha-1-like [Sander lucioperca]
MALTREFFTCFLCTAMTTVYHCEATAPLPPPTGLKYSWLDPFTVNVSWQQPRGLQVGEVLYKYRPVNDETDKSVVCTGNWTNFTGRFLTEEMGSDRRTYHVWTVKSCDDRLNERARAAITVRTPKPRAEVKDIRCLINSTGMNCSWRPGNQTFTLSYRVYGNSPGEMKKCDQPYSSGCYLKVDAVNDICVLLDTGAGRSTFKPAHEILPQKLSVTEEGDNLILSWPPPELCKNFWIYEVCYNKCNEPKVCLNFTTKGESGKMAYDKRCLYEFQSRAWTSHYCLPIFSGFGDVVTYGTNEPPDGTLTVVAIVIPVILSACIILSCYCFRRHRSIICPTIPDPSAIFKEMMLNGNKEFKTTPGSLYTPVPEPVEPCKITLSPRKTPDTHV